MAMPTLLMSTVSSAAPSGPPSGSSTSKAPRARKEKRASEDSPLARVTKKGKRGPGVEPLDLTKQVDAKEPLGSRSPAMDMATETKARMNMVLNMYKNLQSSEEPAQPPRVLTNFYDDDKAGIAMDTEEDLGGVPVPPTASSTLAVDGSAPMSASSTFSFSSATAAAASTSTTTTTTTTTTATASTGTAMVSGSTQSASTSSALNAGVGAKKGDAAFPSSDNPTTPEMAAQAQALQQQQQQQQLLAQQGGACDGEMTSEVKRKNSLHALTETAVSALSELVAVAQRFTPSPDDLTAPAADSAAQILTNLYTPPTTPLDKAPRSRLPSASSLLGAGAAAPAAPNPSTSVHVIAQSIPESAEEMMDVQPQPQAQTQQQAQQQAQAQAIAAALVNPSQA